MPVDTDLLAAIDTAVSTLTAGTNLWIGPVRGATDVVPQFACFVLHAGGAGDPINYCDGSATPQWRTDIVSVRTRGNAGDFSGAQVLARAVAAACHDASVSGYVMCRVQGGSPVYLGDDQQGCHEFLVTVLMTHND